MNVRIFSVVLVLFPPLLATALPDEAEPIDVAEFPRFNELLDWVNFVRRDGFVLLRATKQNDYFVAVFRDRDGRLAFCTDAKKPLGGRSSVSTISFADENGKNIDDVISKGLTPLVRSFKRKSPNGEVVTIAIADGKIIPLKQGDYKRVRITFSIGTETPDRIIFDEFVEIR
jgi:hypothetical protein